MMEAIVALAIIVVILQMGLSVYQVRYYDKFIRQLVQKYSNSDGYKLNTETAKSIFNNVIVVVVSDQDNTIKEAYELKGSTIFSKFKIIEGLVGRKINETLINEIENKKKSLSRQALLKIFKK